MTNPLEKMGFTLRTKEFKDALTSKEEEKEKSKGTLFTACLVILGILIGAPVFITLLVLVYTFVFITLWEWFMIPLGLMSISFFHAAGISLFLNFILLHVAKHDYFNAKDGKKDANPVSAFCCRMFVYLIFLPALFLGLGLVFKNLM